MTSGGGLGALYHRWRGYLTLYISERVTRIGSISDFAGFVASFDVVVSRHFFLFVSSFVSFFFPPIPL